MLDTGWYGPYFTIIGNTGGEVLKNGKSNFSDPKVIKGLKVFYDLFQTDKSAPSPASLKQAGVGQSQLFETGKVAMYASGRWMVPTYRKSLKFDWTAVEMPKGERRINPIFSGMLAVSAKSPHKDAAIKLLSYVLSRDGLKDIIGLGLAMPTNTKFIDDPEMVNEPPDLAPFKAAAAYHGYDSQWALAQTGQFSEFFDKYINPELDKAFNGQQSVEDAAKNIDTKANAELFK